MATMGSIASIPPAPCDWNMGHHEGIFIPLPANWAALSGINNTTSGIGHIFCIIYAPMGLKLLCSIYTGTLDLYPSKYMSILSIKWSTPTRAIVADTSISGQPNIKLTRDNIPAAYEKHRYLGLNNMRNIAKGHIMSMAL